MISNKLEIYVGWTLYSDVEKEMLLETQGEIEKLIEDLVQDGR